MCTFKQFITESFDDNAYVFDVDDTLVTTDAKVIVRDEQGAILDRLSPARYNTYQRKQDEVLDFSEFKSPDLFKATAVPTDYLQVMKNISDAVNRKESNSFLYILTARGDTVKNAIHDYLKSFGIYVRPIEIHTVGDDTETPISELKRRVLNQIRNKHIGSVVFFDDDEKNISLAKQIPGIITRHVKI